MAYDKISASYYIADTKEDLVNIREKRMGTECYVIKEACEYKLMSTGEWIKQTASTAASAGGSIDTSEFATKTELQDAIEGIQIPSVEGLASEKFVEDKIAKIEIPSIKGLATETFVNEAIEAASLFENIYGDDHQFGLMINADENISLVDAMRNKGKGLYNFWVEKGSIDQPEEVIEKNSSCRGICCVDTIHEAAGSWYGWIIMFDHEGEIYVRYIRRSQPTSWKHLAIV